LLPALRQRGLIENPSRARRVAFLLHRKSRAIVSDFIIGEIPMKHIKTGTHRRTFETRANSRTAQAAMMVLRPGQSTGEPMNEHPQSEQWLFVLSGSGTALVNKRRVAIKKNSLLLIEKGKIHQVANTGHGSLITLNFYTPVAYTADGELKK
jgi:mannose-6-phosphate isomerase-like protein (cupin superfamily)